jgi:site-specific DNA recombinase
VSAIAKLLDRRDRLRRALKALGASGQLGYGIPEKSLEAGLERAPDYIGADMGSIDPGPYYLGSGELATAPATTRADLTVRHQLAANAGGHRQRAKAAEPSLLAGLLVDARGERLTPSHAVKKGRRYRYYVSASLITGAGMERAQGWRLAAREIEEAVIRILIDGLSSPARLLDRFGVSGMPSDQTRKIHTRAARLIASLGGAPEQRSSVLRELVEKVVVDEQTIIIKVRRAPLFGSSLSSVSDAPADGAVELTAAITVKRRGVETRLVLLDAQQNHTARSDPALVKAIARGRAWFDELATGRARSLQDLAKRHGISRRYIRRLVGLAFLSPSLVEAILQGRQPVELTATRLTEFDLPLDWTEQHRPLGA